MYERMNSARHHCDVLIIGGGPAGVAAACAAAASGQRLTLVDDNPGAGGQIWRGQHRKPENQQAARWLKRLDNAKVEVIYGARVFQQPEAHVLLAESLKGVYELSYRKLILATGARERFLPFQGWTLPNVFGAGGLQALVKSGMPVNDKKVVIAGSGPLLLPVAAYLRKQGAQVSLIAEQATRRQLFGFAFALANQADKIAQAIKLKLELRGVPYLTDCYAVAANADEEALRVTLRRGARTWDVACDYLACGFHLVPNVELASLLDCALADGCVQVDEFQETSLAEIYCAGEPTGIGGLELALVEGEIAGYAATDRREEARKLFALRDKLRRFANALNRAFALREELKTLVSASTIVCRCEDVTFGHLQKYDSWRAAKLQTRCGMGPCQGRVCGPAIEFLLDWKAESVRPPIFPVRLDSLAKAASPSNGEMNH
jgi:NADPH-dependent 2,4-dienoyl-CoA reductase/sulfur reductase-like enzyme